MSSGRIMRADIVERALVAVATGEEHRRSFSALGREGLWREFFVHVAELPGVHPKAQEDFLAWWTQLGWHLRRHQIKDDDVLLLGLRRLLPPYEGPPLDLWRGQGRDEPVGISWTSSVLVARKFALYGTRLLEMYDDRGDPSAAILAAEAEREGLRGRPDAVMLEARQVPPTHIICASCRQGYDYEDEYLVDPRGLTMTYIGHEDMAS
jgi:hypothetical protein